MLVSYSILINIGTCFIKQNLFIVHDCGKVVSGTNVNKIHTNSNGIQLAGNSNGVFNSDSI